MRHVTRRFEDLPSEFVIIIIIIINIIIFLCNT